MDEVELDARIKDKGLTAPRVSLDMIDATIIGCQYHVFPGNKLTVCSLQLRNGFIVTGESACVSPANYNKGLGEEVSYSKARNKIWELEGYLLQQRMHDAVTERAAKVAP